jgi:hypothetical protein
MAKRPSFAASAPIAASLDLFEAVSSPNTTQLETESDTFSATGTVRRKRVRMGSRYQEGRLETLGRWVYGRFWVDAPEGRKRAAEKICPVEGPGSLTVAAQRRKLAEIILASGVNNQTKIIEANLGTTFRQQAKWFTEHAKTDAQAGRQQYAGKLGVVHRQMAEPKNRRRVAVTTQQFCGGATCSRYGFEGFIS